MRRPLVALLLVLPAIACGAVAGDYEDDADAEDQHQAQNHKEVGGFNGHSLLDLSSLGLLAALKVKFVVVLLVALAVFLLLTKGYKTQCVFGNCRPNYSTYGYYPYVDYTYMGYELPSNAAAAAYRRPAAGEVTVVHGVPGVVAKDSHHLSGLTARVWNSIDLASMAFGALNIQEEDCRRKLVCQADRAAARSPMLRAAMSWFNLARYRTDRPRGGDSDASEHWRQEDPCEEMYPLCLHRDLPAALGGPTRPSVLMGHHHDLHGLHHHHGHHQHHHQHLDQIPGHVVDVVDLPAEQWQPVEYRPEYQYTFYPSYREPIKETIGGSIGVPVYESGGEPVRDPFREETIFPSYSPTSASVTPPREQASASAVLGPDLIHASATVTVTAPVFDGATTTTPSTTTSSTAAARSTDGPPEPRAPSRTTNLVWRRMHFAAAAPAPSNRTKLHAD